MPLASTLSLPARTRVASTSGRASSRRSVVTKAVESNVFINLIASTACGAAAAAVTVVTAENKEKEIARVQTVEGAIPIAAAIGADIIAHSVLGLNLLLPLLSEPAGAACGVAYMMSLVLSSPSVDPDTLAPKGTIINAEKAVDSRGSVRVPFTQIVPTVVKVTDTTNSGSSGAGWTIGENGLPKLPITSVALVVGVGAVILEVISHAPVLSIFMPRVLQVAFWYAALGPYVDKRQ